MPNAGEWEAETRKESSKMKDIIHVGTKINLEENSF